MNSLSGPDDVKLPRVIYYLNETLKAATPQIEWAVIEYPYAFSEGAT